MQVAKTNTGTKTSFASPLRIRSNDNFSALIFIAVVYIKLQLFSFMSLNERKQIFAFVQDGISTNNIVAERPQASRFCWWWRMNFQDMPDVLIGSFKTAESNWYSK